MNCTQTRIAIINDIIENHPLLEKIRIKMVNFCLGYITTKIIRLFMFKLMNKEELQDFVAHINKLYVKRCHKESNDHNSTFFD